LCEAVSIKIPQFPDRQILAMEILEAPQ
jgi:hypothetical protein